MGHRFALIDSFSPRLIADNLRQFYLIYPKAKGQRAFDYTEEHSRKEIHVRSLVHEKWCQQTTGLNGLREKKTTYLFLFTRTRKIFFKYIKPCLRKEKENLHLLLGQPVCCHTKTFYCEVTFVELLRYLIGCIFLNDSSNIVA